MIPNGAVEGQSVQVVTSVMVQSVHEHSEVLISRHVVELCKFLHDEGKLWVGVKNPYKTSNCTSVFKSVVVFQFLYFK